MQYKDSLIIVGHATSERKTLVRLYHGLGREGIPKSSEEQEVGMVGLRMQDMVGDVDERGEWRRPSAVKAVVSSKVTREDPGCGFCRT